MRNLLFLCVLFICNSSVFSQNNIGFHFYIPISNTINGTVKPLDYHGNTQASMNLELFYERETTKRLHHFGVSYQANTFNYLDSNIQKFIEEDYTTINYTLFNKGKIGDCNLYTGSGTLISILNQQKNYRLNSTNLLNKSSFGEIIKFSLFLETKLILPPLPKKNKFKQAVNFRIGLDLGGIKSNNAVLTNLMFVSGGYSMFYTF